MIPLTTMPTPTRTRVLLYEGTGATPFGTDEKLALLTELLQKGVPVSVTTLSPKVSRTVVESRLLVVGRFVELPVTEASSEEGIDVQFLDVSGVDIPSALAKVEAVRGASTAKPWKPWFPVIDYDRCTNCMQCLSFCLFDVYGVSADKKIEVRNQDKCKTDCPACSRVCPEVAILFPKYRHGPINGDKVSADDVRRETMKVDISSLLGGDIYQALRDRSAKAKSRFSKERDEDRALEERKKCLVKLGEKLDIPAEVFESLPSLDEIRAKADRAAAAAAEARGS